MICDQTIAEPLLVRNEPFCPDTDGGFVLTVQANPDPVLVKISPLFPEEIPSRDSGDSQVVFIPLLDRTYPVNPTLICGIIWLHPIVPVPVTDRTAPRVALIPSRVVDPLSPPTIISPLLVIGFVIQVGVVDQESSEPLVDRNRPPFPVWSGRRFATDGSWAQKAVAPFVVRNRPVLPV